MIAHLFGGAVGTVSVLDQALVPPWTLPSAAIGSGSRAEAWQARDSCAEAHRVGASASANRNPPPLQQWDGPSAVPPGATPAKASSSRRYSAISCPGQQVAQPRVGSLTSRQA